MERRMAQDAKRLQLQREQTLTDFTQMVKQLESDDPDDGVMENDSLVRKWTLEGTVVRLSRQSSLIN